MRRMRLAVVFGLIAGTVALGLGASTGAQAAPAKPATAAHELVLTTAANPAKHLSALPSVKLPTSGRLPQVAPDGLTVAPNTVYWEKFYNFYSYRVLDADTGTIGANGTRVQLWDDLGAYQYNQFWWLIDTGYHDNANGNELYKLYNYYSGRVLDADLGTIGGNGTRVQLWDDLGVYQYNQDWEF